MQRKINSIIINQCQISLDKIVSSEREHSKWINNLYGKTIFKIILIKKISNQILNDFEKCQVFSALKLS